MLKIQLDEITDTGLYLEGEMDPVDLPQLNTLGNDGLSRFPDPVAYKFSISRIADIVEIKGELESSVDLSCGRCLDKYRMPLTSRFALAYTRQLPDCVDEEGEEIELSAEELGLTLIEADEIDLSEPLQEQLLMALPIKPLCNKDCKGLCAHCGANLNNEKCSCEDPVFDTRFASLKNFKVK